MTRVPHDNPPAPAASASTTRGPGALVLAVHEQADGAALVVLRAATASTPAPTLVAANHIAPAELTAAIAAAVKRHKPSAVVRVAPSAWCVTRAVATPPGTADRKELAQALALLAEAELPGSAPDHRRAAAPFTLANAGAPEAVILAAWVAGPSAQPAQLVRTESWCPEPVALAAVAALAVPAPAALLARADRSGGGQGVLTILGAGPRRPIARTLRPDSADWDAAATEAVTESALALGIDPPSGSIDPAGLWMSAPVRPGAIVGVDTSDTRWLARFAPALGAALVAASTDPAVRPAAELQADSPELHTSQLQRAAVALATPSRTAAAIAIAAALVLLAPVGAAAARYALLSARAGGTPPIDQRLADAERRAAHAELLRSHRWPMTKLWADVAGAAPVGVEIDSLDLSPEDGLAIRGTAQSPDLVANFRKRLSDTAVFRDIANPTLADEDGRTTFQLSAKVGAPFYRATPADDFAAKPLAQRLYGEGATNLSASSAERRDRDRGGNTGRNGSRSDRATRRDERTASDRPVQPAGPALGTAPPPPLTDEQIAAMDGKAAMKEFGARTKAAAIPGLDETTRQRLKDEAGKVQQRMIQALQSGGGGGGGGGSAGGGGDTATKPAGGTP
jgi:hypothetical protein